ncbi:hypothetical protein B0H16DRAFT_1270004, partial [Mycena metata]
SFFAIPDEDVESKLNLQSPWLFCLKLNQQKIGKLTVHYVASWIVESFKLDLFVICSEDNSEKLIIWCRVLGGGNKEDAFLRQVVNSVSLR